MPEHFIDICSFYEKGDQIREISSSARQQYLNEFRKLSQNGYKVLAIGYKVINNPGNAYSVADEMGLILSGFLIFNLSGFNSSQLAAT